MIGNSDVLEYKIIVLLSNFFEQVDNFRGYIKFGDKYILKWRILY